MRDFEKIKKQFGVQSGSNVPNVVMVTDAGKDLDDEHALVLAAGLHRMGFINFIGAIANLEPAKDRARLVKGTLNELGFPNISVGIGSACFKGGTNQKHETEAPYAPEGLNLYLTGGQYLFYHFFQDFEDKSIALVLNSGLTDAASFFMGDPDAFCRKVASVSIMGGVVADGNEIALDDVGFMQAQIGKNGAANNCFDEASALFLYRACQENKIPLTVIMREAAYACQIPFSVYDQMAGTGNPIGINLKGRQTPSMNMLWHAATAPEGSAIRGKLPMSRDRKWFINTFCDGNDPGISDEEDIWPYVGRFQLYDPMNVIAAVPSLRERFYQSIEIKVKGITHRVIGLTKERNGIADEESLRNFLIEVEVAALEAAMQ